MNKAKRKKFPNKMDFETLACGHFCQIKKNWWKIPVSAMDSNTLEAK
jgi:hypothetical protein